MNNFYIQSDYRYNEKAIALDEFVYDSYVPFSIPSVMALMDKTNNITTNHKMYGANLVNKDKSKFNLPSIVTVSNNVLLFVSSKFALNNEWDKDRQCYIGKKGLEFIVSFVGGNSNNYRIIGRYDYDK